MKKILSLILVLSMLLMLFSCTGNQVAQNETTKAENVAGDAANAAEEDFSNYVPKCGTLTRNIISTDDIETIIKSRDANNNSKKTYYDDLNTAILALDRGDIDYFFTNESTIKYIMNQNPGKYSMRTLNMKTYEEYSMGALEKNKDIIDKIDKTIYELDESDELWNLKLKNMEITNESNKSKMPHFDNASTYRVILTGDIPPMDYVNTSGEPVGFNVDLLTTIANKLKVNFEIVTSNAASRFLMLTSDKADIAFWTLKVSALDKDATNREVLEVSVNNDDSKLKELCNDVPKGIVTTRPYMMNQQAQLFLKDSKYERYLKLDKKETMPDTAIKFTLAGQTQVLHGDFDEVEITEDDKNKGITARYKMGDDVICEEFSFDNKEKLSLTDFVNEKRKKYSGCVEDKTEEMGCKCILHTFAINRNDKEQIERHYHFEDDGKIAGYIIIDNTKEVRLGNSNYYINIPVIYGNAKNIDQRTVIEGAEDSIYKSSDERFYPNISMWRWDENKCNYNDMKVRLKGYNSTCNVTESDYNSLAKGGWTLDKYYDLQLKTYGDKVIDNLKGKNNFEIDYTIVEIIKTIGGIKVDKAIINVMDNEKIIEIQLAQPQKYWKAMGEAIAQTIHKK